MIGTILRRVLFLDTSNLFLLCPIQEILSIKELRECLSKSRKLSLVVEAISIKKALVVEREILTE